jgi:SAM-dependent methyltransferase
LPNLHWQFAPGLDGALRDALVRAFQPEERLLPLSGSPEREIVGRRYGVLPHQDDLAFDVFVKVFRLDSFGSRLRHHVGRSGAAREFAHGVALARMGLPVSQPLALVHERTDSGARRSYLWIQYVAGSLSLAKFLKSPAAAPDRLDAVPPILARLLVDLAARGVWHRDVRPENILLTCDNSGRPLAAALVDVRHTVVSAQPEPLALRRMLVTLAAFLLLDGADRAWVTTIVEAAAERARRENPDLLRTPVEEVVNLGLATAQDLLARLVRKGRRSRSALDTFARRYGTAAAAENYRDRRFRRSASGRRVDEAERRLLAGLLRDLSVTGPVLDVPCGAGRLTPILAAGDRAVIGADVAEEMLRLSRRAAEEAHADCQFLAADARRLPLADGTFDLAMAMRLLHRVRRRTERLEVLKELARVSRKYVVFSFYNRWSLAGLRDRARGRYAGESRGAIAAEVAEAGMRVERFVPVGAFGRQTLVVCNVSTGKAR